MRLGNLPMTQRRRLIVVEAEVYAELYFAHRVGEIQIGWRGIDGVAAEDHEKIDLAGVHVGDEVAQRVDLIYRLRLDGLCMDNGLAGVVERLVHAVGENVDRRRLAVAGDDEAAAAMRLQIFRDRVAPCRDRGADVPTSARRCWRTRLTWPTRQPERARDPRGEASNLTRPSGQPMVGARAGGRGHRLDRVEPVHAIDLLGPPPGGEVARVAQRAGAAAEEVGVERQDHVGLIEPILRLDVLAERDSG